MKMIPNSFALGVTCLIATATFSLGLSAIQGQEAAGTSSAIPMAPAVSQPLPINVELGRAVAQPRSNLQITYTVMSTAPAASKAVNQKIRLIVDENGMRDVITDGQTTQRQGTSTRNVSINTGKYKNIGQLNATVADFFRKFLGATSPNQELGKIGDVRYGGELRFVAETPNSLRFDYVPGGNPSGAIRFTRADVQAFLGILAK